jgi:uncharacterized delta-60 repeat protein
MKTSFSLSFLIFVFSIVLPGLSVAQPGTLDLSFGTGGKVTTSFSNGDDTGSDVVIQPDGKIILAGTDTNNTEFALVRYNSDGSPDNLFGTGGKVRTDLRQWNDYGHAVAILSSGKILVGGSSTNGLFTEFALVRYNNDGSLDNTFGTGGIAFADIGPAEDQAYAMAVQDDGKIILAGSSFIYNGVANTRDFAVARFNSDGSLDNTFGTGGKVITPIGTSDEVAYSVVIQDGGKIIVAGERNGPSPDYVLACALVRYNSNGSLDNTFGTGGILVMPLSNLYSTANAVTLQDDGQILVAGSTRIDADTFAFAVARLNDNGSFDNSFGTSGVMFTTFASTHNFCFGMALQGDGKIILSGRMHTGISPNQMDFAVARYTTNGTLDNTFGTGGKVTTHMGWPEDTGYSIAVQTDGKIVVGGAGVNGGVDSDFVIARYNGDGTVAVEENTEQNVRIYPNPANGKLTIENGQWIIEQVAIYNAFGQLVTSSVVEKQQTTLDISNFAAGIYFVKINTGTETYSGKIIVE